MTFDIKLIEDGHELPVDKLGRPDLDDYGRALRLAKTLKQFVGPNFRVCIVAHVTNPTDIDLGGIFHDDP